MTRHDAAGRRGRVVDALTRHPEGVSGEELAHALGISRAAVGKHVTALRALGYEIHATPARGYRLRSRPDAPIPYEVGPLLTVRPDAVLVGGGVTGSTNDDARALAAEGAGDWTVVLASEQTGGRGRLGRTWSSPAGGVYLSIVLRPDVAPADAGALPLVVGLGVATGLERLGVRTALKWPNDVVAPSGAGGGTGKIAGVLLESLIEGERLAWVVAGVGVNVRRAARPADGRAVHVDDLAGRRVPLAEVAAAILDGIAACVGAFQAEGFGALADGYRARCALTGRDVTVRDAAGRVVADGVAEGIDDTGRLVVRSADGATPVSAGDVTLRS